MNHKIGIIGAGAIVLTAHLPAYRRAGFHVAAIADPNVENAQKAAAEFSIPQVFARAEDLIANADVDVVDIAVPPMDQRRIAGLAVEARKHILCQKPLSWTFEDAVRIVRDARRHDLVVAVNQQFRWSPIMKNLQALLARGVLGPPEFVTFDISTFSDWSTWSWLVDQPRLDLLAHSIHYLDGLRFLFGEPRNVSTIGRRSSGQRAAGESMTITTLDFGRTIAVLTVNHNVPFSEFARGEIRVSGPDGAYEGQLGLYSGLNFAWREPDHAKWQSKSEVSPRRPLPGLWMPDAFAGPMLSLLEAIDHGCGAATSGEDNLKTLAVVFAGYQSMETGLPVSPSKLLAETIKSVDDLG